MSVKYNPSIVTSGLLLYVDAGNSYSYSTGITWFDARRGVTITGSLVNGPTFNTGNYGSIVFDGSNDQANFGTVVNSATSARSMMMFVKYNAAPVDFALNGYSQSGVYSYLGIDSSRNFYYYVGGATTGGAITTTKLVTGSWYCQTFAMASDGSRKVYLNTTEITSSTGTVGVTPTSTFYLGRTGDGYYANANIGACLFYNKQLTAQEIIQNFNVLKNRYGI